MQNKASCISKKDQRLISRRRFVIISTVALTTPQFLAWSGSSEYRSASWRISSNGKAVGIKLTEDARGRLIVSAREMKGKKLYIIPIGEANGGPKRHLTSKMFKMNNGTTMSISLDKRGRISTSLEGVSIGPVQYAPGTNNDEQSEGILDIFNWLGDRINDFYASIAAAIIGLAGGNAIIDVNGGGFLRVNGGKDKTVVYQGSKSGFKLEPGQEGDPNVWY